jgi:beta-lactam-binding protein with PASTA domain
MSDPITNKEFLRSPKFRNHFMISVGVSFLLLMIVFFSLRIITQHNQTIEVPDLHGLSIPEVESVLEEAGLRFEIIDSVYVSDIPKGSVFDQIPAVHTPVKSNRKILLTTNAFGMEKVFMPYLIGISFRQAQTMMKNAGLQIGKLSYIPDIAVNNVLRQEYAGREIKAGTPIPKNATIDLVLGQGLSTQKTMVPYLIGLSLEEARRLVLEKSLNLGAVMFDHEILTGEDSLQSRIWKQIPSRQREEGIFLGSPIDLWLTMDESKVHFDSTLARMQDTTFLPSQ